MPDSRPADDADELFVELAPKVHRWISRYLGPVAAVDDVAQDALIEIAKALPRFRGDSSVDTFAYRIATRVASRALKNKPRESVALELVPPQLAGVDPRSQLANRELIRALYRALDKLTPIRRLAFVLCDVEGMTPTEAARILKKRPATVRSRLRRARVELSHYLELDEIVAPLGEHL